MTLATAAATSFETLTPRLILISIALNQSCLTGFHRYLYSNYLKSFVRSKNLESIYNLAEVLLSYQGFAGGIEVAGHWFLDPAHDSLLDIFLRVLLFLKTAYQTGPVHSFSTSFMLLSLSMSLCMSAALGIFVI